MTEARAATGQPQTHRKSGGVPAPAAPGPFFVVGAPRTGSTLLRRLLSAHSRVAIPPESGFLAEYLEADRIPLDTRKRLLCEEPELEYWGVRPTPGDLAGLDSIAACVRLVHEKYARAQGKDLWGQKTPKLVRHVELLLAHMPEARFVHVVRDGRAVATSLRESPEHRLHVLYGARRYAQDTRRGLELEARHPERVFRVYYEDLVRAPEAVMRALCNFLGIASEPALWSAHSSAAPLQLTPKEQRKGHHAHVDAPVDPRSIDKWRRELTHREVRAVEHVAGDVLDALGYGRLEAEDAPAALERGIAHVLQLGASMRKAYDEAVRRPDAWRIARRRWKLGTVERMLRDHWRGM